MPSAAGVEAGFCFESLAEDKETLVVVNVCGHSSVGMALAKNMEPVPETYLDEYGLDNLIIPISVGPPQKYEGKKYNFVIDVAIHPSLTQRCVKSHHLFEHFVTRLTTLAIDWILQESGIRLNARYSRLFPDRKYFENSNENIRRIFSEIAKTVEKEIKKEGIQEKNHEESFLPPELQLDDSKNVTKTKRTPLVTEMPKSSGIRKGFLNNAQLYGSKGSSECNLPQPDPLLHLPEKLRNKCQVIDTRQLNSMTTSTERKSSASTSKTPENKGSEITISDVSKEHSRQWTVLSVNCSEKEIVVRLYPPSGVTSMKDVNLTVTSDTIEVDNTLVQLPKSIAMDDVSAKFLKSSMTMIVTCPLA
ncbi:PIH1 [Trypanosoma melophagium]|uniref:PIH1 n=1 Tax=Trypanosoma melophagium TaxID=715481 RepID=UPI00351A6D8E|nr:PIH1 [Trypanosoma melophagium]